MSARLLLEHATWYESAADIDPNFLGSSVQFGFAGLHSAFVPDLFCKQIHSTLLVDADLAAANEADGIFTTTSCRTLAVQTADCLPILIASSLQPFVCVVHAGWRGLSGGILTNAFRIYQNACAGRPDDLRMIMGPAIGPLHFEVGPEVIRAFAGKESMIEDSELALCLTKGRADRWHFCMQSFAVLQATRLGIRTDSIGVLRSCTFEHDKEWFSYRRDKSRAGRNWSWIRLLEGAAFS